MSETKKLSMVNNIPDRIMVTSSPVGRSFSLSQVDIGAPGTHNILVTVPLTPSEGKKESESKLADNSKREWIITASLCKSIEWHDDISFDIDSDKSGSFIEIPKDTTFSQIKTIEGIFSFHKNAKNEISVITFTCIAPSLHEARRIFINGINPLLDFFSFSANIPVAIDRIIASDKKHYITSLSYDAPYKTVTILPHIGHIHKGLEPVFALYREAKNNNSYFYKFLCYYKIMEGIYKILRPEIRKIAKEANIDLEQEREIVPDDIFLRKNMSGAIGKNIGDLYDNEFTPKYRNSVSHFVLSDGIVLNISDYHSHANFQNVIYLIELCARILVDNHIKMCTSVYGNPSQLPL